MTEYLSHFLAQKPTAAAFIRGSADYPEITGTLALRQTPAGVLVTASFANLPDSRTLCRSDIFALHIHSGTSCTGNAQNPFAAAQGHFNPDGCTHPNHAGDLMPLFASAGRAWYSYLTRRFTIEQVLGRVAIVHRNPDDFTTQPSGNAGEMIACGVIRRWK